LTRLGERPIGALLDSGRKLARRTLGEGVDGSRRADALTVSAALERRTIVTVDEFRPVTEPFGSGISHLGAKVSPAFLG
jgi:hypothetical protein